MKMNHCSVKQQSAYAAACEEMRRENVSIYGERRESVICPKPRRLGFCDPVRPLRWQLSHQADICESKAGTDLLDIILPKGGFGAEQSYGHQVASSPPFFSGSPPSRVSNPLIQDTRFGDEKIAPFSPFPSGISTPSPNSCVRANFGANPAVRVEGFNCLGRDNRRVPALA